MPLIRVTEPRSGLDVRARLLDDKAPANADFLRRYAAGSRAVPSIHAMWTGPEISCPVPDAHLDAADRATGLPLENATLNPLPGDVVLAYVAPRVWGGSPTAIFDIGLFYGPGGRMLFPIGWHAGSVTAKVLPEDLDAMAAGCGAIRRTGACEVTFSLIAD